MRPTSEAQARAVEQGGVPPLERVRERVWSLPVPMPLEQSRLAYTLTYLLLDEDDRVHVIDPGSDSDTNWELLDAAVHEVSERGEIASIIVTHLHPDHLGLAERARRETAAPIVLHEREVAAMGDEFATAHPVPQRWGIPEHRFPELEAVLRAREAQRVVEPDFQLRGAVDRIPVPGVLLEAIHTPGHTAGHVSLRLPDEGLLFTGDHVLPMIYPGLGLGGRSAENPIDLYLQSLDVLEPFDDHEVLPGHGYRFAGLAERQAAIRAHHLQRADEVAAVLAEVPTATVYEVASRLTWSAGWSNLRGFFFSSALLQTALHIDRLHRL